MKTFNGFVLCFLLFPLFSWSQNEKIDSLWTVYRKANYDTVKIRLLNEQIGYFMESINPDSAIGCYLKAIQLAENQISSNLNYPKGEVSIFNLYKANSLRYIGMIYTDKGNNSEAREFLITALSLYENLNNSSEEKFKKEGLKGISRCHNSLGILCKNQGDNTHALEHYKKSLTISEELGETERIAGYEMNIGTVYTNIGDYDAAIEYQYKALKSFEEIGSKDGISMCYKNIGKTYRLQGIYDKALDSYLQSLKLEEESGNARGISRCYNSIAIVQKEMGNPDIAIEYYTKSLKIAEEIGDKYTIADCYGNIGNIESDRNNFDLSNEYYSKSLRIEEELGDKEGIATKLNNIGTNYHMQGDLFNTSNEKVTLYSKAIDFYKKALIEHEAINNKDGIAMVKGNIALLNLRIAELQNEKILGKQNIQDALKYGEAAFKLAESINSLPLMKSSSNVLQNTYKRVEKYSEALFFAEVYIAVKDSMFREEKTKAITEMQTKYETEKKQQEIEKQQLMIEKQEIDNRRQRNQRNFFIAGTFLLALLALVVYRGYRQKKQSNAIITEKNVLLEQANEEIAAQRDLVTEQRDHIEKIHEEVTSSIRYASRIQGAVLPAPTQMAELLGDHFVLFKPKDIVSGDFYWATRVKHFLIFCVADCTGHGVPGAFMSMLGVSFLNDIVHKEHVTTAAEVLNHLRDSVIAALKQKGEGGEQKDGMDMGLCVIDTETHKMQFAGGYNPCWVVPNPEISNPRIQGESKEEARVIQLRPDKMPIAIHKHMEPYTNHNLQLYPGDQIYLMSDGFQDQFGGAQGKKFMVKNLRELVVANAHLPMEQQHKTLERALEEWENGAEQVDDVTIMGVRI